jgi:hypothetical protein
LGKDGDEFLGQAVREVLVLRVWADVGERENGQLGIGWDRGSVCGPRGYKTIDLDGGLDPLEGLWPKAVKAVGDLVVDLVVDLNRKTDTPRIREGFYPGGDIDRIPEDVLADTFDISHVDAYPDLERRSGSPGIPFVKMPLEVHGTLDRL